MNFLAGCLRAPVLTLLPPGAAHELVAFAAPLPPPARLRKRFSALALEAHVQRAFLFKDRENNVLESHTIFKTRSIMDMFQGES